MRSAARQPRRSGLSARACLVAILFGLVAIGVGPLEPAAGTSARMPAFARGHGPLDRRGIKPAPSFTKVFTISDPGITESSDLEISSAHPGLVYTTNDSGDTATVYVLDRSNGDLVGQTLLSGVDAIDFEAIALAGRHDLMVADVGDNTAVRSSVAIYRFPQPVRGNHVVSPQTVTLHYVDGPHNAESALYDTSNGRVFVVTKEFGGAKVYRTPRDVFAKASASLHPIASAPPIATDATWLRGHRFVLIRNYIGAYVYTFPSWRRVATFDLPAQQQGESVAAVPGGKLIWIGSEGVDSSVLQVRLPPLPGDQHRTAPISTAPPSSTAPGSTGPTTTTTSASHASDKRVTILVLAGSLGALIIVLANVAAKLGRGEHR